MLDTACISPIQSVCAMFSFGLQKSILAYLRSSFITFKHLNRSHYNGQDCVPMHSFTVLTYSKSKAFGCRWNESTSTSRIGHFEKRRHETSRSYNVLSLFRARNALHVRHLDSWRFTIYFMHHTRTQCLCRVMPVISMVCAKQSLWYAEITNGCHILNMVRQQIEIALEKKNKFQCW